MHQSRGVQTANPFPNAWRAPGTSLEKAEPCLPVPFLGTRRGRLQSGVHKWPVTRGVRYPAVLVSALIRVVPASTFGTEQPLVSAAPETALTEKLSCSMGCSPAAVLWHGAGVLAFLPQYSSSEQSCSCCRAWGIRQSCFSALPHPQAGAACPQPSPQVTACNTSSAWFGREDLKACSACGWECVWDQVSVGRAMHWTGQGRCLAVAFFTGDVQRGL